MLGLTILLVEDSRCCSQAVRMMTAKSGARLRRADCLRSARRHLAIYRPDVLMVDLGLPDGSGTDLIRELQSNPDMSSAIVALSGDDGGPGRAQALKAGATCFLTKPLQDIASFQQVILKVMSGQGWDVGFVPRLVGSPVAVDNQAFVDDLALVNQKLPKAIGQGDMTALKYLAQFTRSVAQTAQDRELTNSASAFSLRLQRGAGWQEKAEQMLALVQRRRNASPPI